MTVLEAYAEAKRMAKYGHKNWIVWVDDGQHYHAERATSETLQRAIDGSREPRVCVKVEANTGICHNVNRAMASIWLNNLKAGY